MLNLMRQWLQISFKGQGCPLTFQPRSLILVKPGIEPSTPGSQGKWLIHYTTAAPTLVGSSVVSALASSASVSSSIPTRGEFSVSEHAFSSVICRDDTR